MRDKYKIVYDKHFNTCYTNASSYWGAGYEPKKAFETGGTWVNKKNQFPAHIWFSFNKRQDIAKIGVKTRNAVVGQIPTAFDVIGTNQDCDDWEYIHWDTLRRVKKTGFYKINQYLEWQIPYPNRKTYKCIGLRLTGTKNKDHLVNIQDIYIFEASFEKVWKEGAGNDS